MQMTKKIVSVVIAVMMVVSMMVVGAVSASAANTVEVGSYAELTAAVTNVASGDTIKITSPFEISTLNIPKSKTIHIDFNGNVLTCTVHKGIVVDGTLYLEDNSEGANGGLAGQNNIGLAVSHWSLYIKSGKYVAHMTDHSKCAFYSEGSTATGDERTKVLADIYVNGGSIESDGYGIWAYGYQGGVTVKGGTITSHYASAISGNGTAKYADYKITISGGTLISDNDTAVYHPNKGTLTISGGTIQGATGVYTKAGTTTISGGTIKSTGDKAAYSYNGNGTNPTGDAIVVDNCDYPAGSPTVTITGGTFQTTDAAASAVASYVKQDDPIYTGDNQERVEGFINGGTFYGAVDNTLLNTDFYTTEDNGDGTTSVVPRQDLVGTWEWIASTDASYRYQAQLTVKDGDTVLETKVYNPKVAANADGSFTYKCAAQTINGVSYGPIDDKTTDANGVIMTDTELNKAVAVAGDWKLGADITYSSFTVYNGFKLDGQGHKITSNSSLLSYATFEVKDKETQFELSNLTLDGINKRYWAVSLYDSKSRGANPNAKATLNNVTIQNYNSSNIAGAVYAFGSSTVVLNDCTITGNKALNSTASEQANCGGDVWAGAKANVIINGGTIGEVLLHGGTANATIDGGATVDTVRFGFTNATEDSTKMKAVVNEATVNEVVSYTDFVEENVVKDPAKANVAAPAGYMWDDSATDGMKTLVPENPINKAMAKADDGNKFGLTCDYKKGAILGVQLKSKAEVDAPVTSESGQETGKDVRFIAVLDTNILRDATDYGFVLAKVDKDTNRKYSNTNFENLKANFGNGEKTISARDTFNNVCGDPAYGDPRLDTAYKYITCAVNGVADNEYVVARFYVTIGGKTYYGKYAGHNYHFTGCMTDANATAIAG